MCARWTSVFFAEILFAILLFCASVSLATNFLHSFVSNQIGTMKQTPVLLSTFLPLSLSLCTFSNQTYSKQNFRKFIRSWHRMASGARITLTSPDPSSNNAPPHTEHEHMIFSESDSDTVTFSAHKHKHNEMASHDASLSSSSSSANTLAIDESTASTDVHSHPQKVKITIDSVAPYETDSNIVDDNKNDDRAEEEKLHTPNRADSIEESEMNMNEHTNDETNHEKPMKNDEL